MHAIVLVLMLASNSPGLCYFDSSEISGFNQFCRYSCLSGDVVITIDALDLCPLSMNDADED